MFASSKRLKITESNLSWISISPFRNVCGLLRFYFWPWLLLVVIFLSVVTAALTLLRLRDEVGLWSRGGSWLSAYMCNVLPPQKTEDNWIELSSVAASLFRNVCVLHWCSRDYFCLWWSFLSVVPAVLALLNAGDGGGLWSKWWVHYVSLSVQGLPPKNTEEITKSDLFWLSASFFTNVCVVHWCFI